MPEERHPVLVAGEMIRQPAGPAISKPSRGVTAIRARESRRSCSCQLGRPWNDSAEDHREVRLAAGGALVVRARTVSSVYDGPGRSTSIRLASNAGLAAIASRTIASRSSAG